MFACAWVYYACFVCLCDLCVSVLGGVLWFGCCIIVCVYVLFNVCDVCGLCCDVAWLLLLCCCVLLGCSCVCACVCLFKRVGVVVCDLS